MSNGDPEAHAARVEQALARADARAAAVMRLPDDVLAVEVHRLRGQLDARDKALDRYRRTATTGGPPPGYHQPGAWANGTPPAPASATDPAAPPLHDPRSSRREDH